VNNGTLHPQIVAFRLSIHSGDAACVPLACLLAVYWLLRGTYRHRASRCSTRISLWSSPIHTQYTTPLSSLITDSSLGHHSFADDTQLFISFRAPELSANILHLQNIIDLVSQPISANLLSFNQSKTEFLLIGLPAQLSKISDPSLLMPSNVPITQSARNLRVILILLSRCLIISPQLLNLASYLFAIFEG